MNVVLTSEINLARGFNSIPIELLLRIFDSNNVVPVPENKSNTKSPSSL